MSSEATNPHQTDQIAQPPPGPLSEYMTGITSQLVEANIGPEEQALAIGDHLTGAIFRFQGTDAGMQTIDALVNNAGQDFSDEQGNKFSWLQEYTRANGLRLAIQDVSKLEHGYYTFFNLNKRIGRVETATGESEPVFTNLDQLSGYLKVTGDDVAGYSVATRTVLDEIGKYLSIPNRQEAWKASENLGSEVHSVKETQKAWQTAKDVMDKAGVDMSIVIRSAEAMKQRKEAGEHVGHIALVEIRQSYDHLFS